MTAVGGQREKLGKRKDSANSVFEDFLNHTMHDNRHGDSAKVNFEPLGLNMNSNRKHKPSGSNGEYDSTMMSNFYSHKPTTKFYD